MKHIKMDVRRHFKEGKTFMGSIITVYEMWVFYSHPDLKRQSAQWLPNGKNPPRKAKVVGSQKKIMLITFFDCKSMINQTQGNDHELQVLCEGLFKVSGSSPDKIPEKVKQGWIFHQDNACPFVSKKTMEFISSKTSPVSVCTSPVQSRSPPADFGSSLS